MPHMDHESSENPTLPLVESVSTTRNTAPADRWERRRPERAPTLLLIDSCMPTCVILRSGQHFSDQRRAPTAMRRLDQVFYMTMRKLTCHKPRDRAPPLVRVSEGPCCSAATAAQDGQTAVGQETRPRPRRGGRDSGVRGDAQGRTTGRSNALDPDAWRFDTPVREGPARNG